MEKFDAKDMSFLNQKDWKDYRPELKLLVNFRWIVEMEHLSYLLFKDIEIDHLNKKIHFNYYNTTLPEKELNAEFWAKNLENWPNEVLIFSCLDGLGEAIKRNTFKGLKTLACSEKYSYDGLEMATTNVVVSYQVEEIDWCQKPSINMKAAHGHTIVMNDEK